MMMRSLVSSTLEGLAKTLGVEDSSSSMSGGATMMTPDEPHAATPLSGGSRPTRRLNQEQQLTADLLARLGATFGCRHREDDERSWDGDSEPAGPVELGSRAIGEHLEEELAALSDAATELAEEDAPSTAEEATGSPCEAPQKRQRQQRQPSARRRTVLHKQHLLHRMLALAVASTIPGIYVRGEPTAENPDGCFFEAWGEDVLAGQGVPGLKPQPDFAPDETPWTDLWTQDPRAVARTRKLTAGVGKPLLQAATLREQLKDEKTTRPYGEREIIASIAGPHGREGDREGADGGARAAAVGGGASSGGGDGVEEPQSKIARVERNLGLKARYFALPKTAVARARALTHTEIYSRPPPPMRKFLLPADAIDGAKESMRLLIGYMAPAAALLTKQFMKLFPARAALQWVSTRVGQWMIGPRSGETWGFSTKPLGAWSNVAFFFAEPQGPKAPSEAELEAQQRDEPTDTMEINPLAPEDQALPSLVVGGKQKPLAAHLDRLNAVYETPRFLGALPEESEEPLCFALLDRLRVEDEDRRFLTSRAEELERLRAQLCDDDLDDDELEAAWEDVGTTYETTAAANVVSNGWLTGGYLVLLVGTKSGKRLPSGDAARIRLMLSGDVRLSFIPVNREVLFSAGALTHLGCPLYGAEGALNARAILYATGALARTLGHFEEADAHRRASGTSEEPLLMNAIDKHKILSETGALADTSRPADLTSQQLEAAVEEWATGHLRESKLQELYPGSRCPGNVEAAFRLGVDALAELGAKCDDSQCKEHIELKAEARSVAHGESYGPPPLPSMEPRYQMLSPRIRKAADELMSRACATAAAVLLVHFSLLASIFTAPFLTFLFEEGLLSHGTDAQRTANATRILEHACRWEGDHARAKYLEMHPEATEAQLKRVQMEARDGHMGPAVRYDRAQCPSRADEVAHLWMALRSVFGLAATAMVEAIAQPTLHDFLAALRNGGEVKHLLGGFGRAKLAVELTYLGLIPREETVPGGPGYRNELSEVLVAIGVLPEGAIAHRVHIDQLGEAIAAAWQSRAAAFLTELCGVDTAEAQDRDEEKGLNDAELQHSFRTLGKRFARALEWQLVRAVLHREVEGLSCEARRWRVGFFAHDCVMRPDGSGLYKPRCVRRGDNRPAAAQPSPETWRAAEAAVPRILAPPSLGEGECAEFVMDRMPLATLLSWCGLRLVQPEF